jgi:hypothetical protein
LLQKYRLEVLVYANNSTLKAIVTIVTPFWKLKNKKTFLAKKVYREKLAFIVTYLSHIVAF